MYDEKYHRFLDMKGFMTCPPNGMLLELVYCRRKKRYNKIEFSNS